MLACVIKIKNITKILICLMLLIINIEVDEYYYGINLEISYVYVRTFLQITIDSITSLANHDWRIY